MAKKKTLRQRRMSKYIKARPGKSMLEIGKGWKAKKEMEQNMLLGILSALAGYMLYKS